MVRSPSTDNQRRPAGRPRSQASRAAILAAAYDLLGEHGLAAFTIEAVAARSGVARTTIYRWWPTKGALAMEGFLEGTAPDIRVSPTGSAVRDLSQLLCLFARLLRGRNGRIIRGILAEGQTDPTTIQAFVAGFVAPRRAEVRHLLDRAVELGELPAALDQELVMASLFGPLYVRVLLGEPISDEWVERFADALLHAWQSSGKAGEPRTS